MISDEKTLNKVSKNKNLYPEKKPKNIIEEEKSTENNETTWERPEGEIIKKDHPRHHSKHPKRKSFDTPQQLVNLPPAVGGRRRRTRKRRKKKRKRGGFKFTTDAIKSRKSRFMTRKRNSRSPKRTRRKRR